MNYLKFTSILLPSIIFITACGSPEGKFKDDDKTQNAGLDTSVKYINVSGATKWEEDWSKANIVVYHWKGEPGSLHPTNGLSNDPCRVIMDYTQRFLVSTDLEHLQIRPDLVKAMPSISADGLRFTYELRDEPTWDDGTQLAVEDVIFTIKAWKCPLTDNAFAKPYFEYVKGVERDPTNPRKFIVIMKSQYVQNIACFGDMPIMERKFHDPGNVLSKYTMNQFNDSTFSKTKYEDLEKWAKEFNDAKYGRDLSSLNGLGMYKITAWEDKQRIELIKKKNHWTSKIKNPSIYEAGLVEKIIFKVNTDDNSIGLELSQQIIDASSWVSTRGLIELSKDSSFTRNYHYGFIPNFGYQYMGLNMKPAAVNRPPFFTDVRVRRAIAYLTPVDDLNNNYMAGKAFRMTSLVSPIKKGIYDTSLQKIPYDIEKAKKLLDEAGWKDSDGDNIRDKMIDGKKVQFECELIISQGPMYVNIANDVAKAMYPAGIKVIVKSLEFGTMEDVIKHHKFDMYLGAWAGPYVAEDYNQIWHSKSWSNGGSNFVGFGTAESDALVDSLRIIIDDAKRIPLEKRLQKIVYDEQPYVFLFSSPRKVVIHKRFDNADFYFERPGMLLSNLRVMSPGNMSKMTPVN